RAAHRGRLVRHAPGDGHARRPQLPGGARRQTGADAGAVTATYVRAGVLWGPVVSRAISLPPTTCAARHAFASSSRSGEVATAVSLAPGGARPAPAPRRARPRAQLDNRRARARRPPAPRAARGRRAHRRSAPRATSALSRTSPGAPRG